MNKTECCPIFDPDKWNEKTFSWKNKTFLKESIPTFLHIPFPPMIGFKVSKLCKISEKANATPAKEDLLLLFSDPSPFKSEMFLEVTKDVPNANNIKISGTFFAKVFDGPYNAIPKFINEMNEILSAKNKKAKNYLVHYAYCPKCSKKYGHNYMILFAEI